MHGIGTVYDSVSKLEKLEVRVEGDLALTLRHPDDTSDVSKMTHALHSTRSVNVAEGVSPSYKQLYGNITVPATVIGGTQYFKAVQGLVTLVAGSSIAEAWGAYGIIVSSADADSLWGVVGELDVAAGALGPGAGQANSFQTAGYFHSFIHTAATFVGSLGIDAPLIGDIWSKTGRRKADAAVAAVLNGDLNQSTAGAGAAFKVYDFNTDSKFDYGLDLYFLSGSYSNVFAVGDLRLSGNTHVISGSATTRQAVETAFPAAPIGSVYVSSGGKIYLKLTDAGANTDWQLVTTSAAD